MGPCGVEMVLMVEYGPEALGDGRLENRFMVSGSRFTVIIEGCRMQGLGFRVEKERQTKCSIGPIGFVGWNQDVQLVQLVLLVGLARLKIR